jgi:hypothetical protein
MTGCVDSTPETPGNAVMEYLTAAQLGDTEEADGRLCRRLRDTPDEGELETIGRIVHETSAFGEGVSRQDESTAEVRLEVLFSPSPQGAQGDPWVAHLAKERGHWKVCGFEPINP